MNQPGDIEPETADVAAVVLSELKTLAAMVEPPPPAHRRLWRRSAGRDPQPTGAA